MWDYTSSVMDHFTNPRNVGEIPDANGIGEVGSLACGDALKLFLKIDPQNEVILDAKFKTFGCASAIASASALTELVKGKTLKEASAVTNDDIAKFLGGLPEQKMHCSVMGHEALEAAIANYRGEKIATHTDHDHQVVCKCFWVTEDKIRKVIRENDLTTVDQITNFTKAGGGCGGCLGDIKRILQEERGKMETEKGGAPKKMTTLQKIQLIQKVLAEEVAPMLQADGGNIELVDVEGNRVIVRLMGACHGCMGAMATLQMVVQQRLREKVSQDLIVVQES